MLLKMQPRLPQYSLTPSLQALQRTSYGYSDYGSYTAAHYSPSSATGCSSSSAYHQYSGGTSGPMSSPVSESFSYYEDDGGIHTPTNSNTEEPGSPHDSISSPPLIVSGSNPQSPVICSSGSFSPTSGIHTSDGTTGSTPPPSYGTTAGTSHHHHHQQDTLDVGTVTAATSSPLYKYPLTATTPNYLPMTPYSPSATTYPSLYSTDHSSPSPSSSNPSLQYCSGSTSGTYNGYYFNPSATSSYTPTSTAVQYGNNSSIYPSEYMHHNTTAHQYPNSQSSLSTSSNSFALWNNYPTAVQVGKVSYDTPRFKLTPERAIPLIKWFEEHKDHPYPSRHEKMVLCQSTQLTFTQVSTWFANARRRMKKAAHDDDDEEECSISDEDKMK